MKITSHMQKIIQIYPCLLKLLRKQDTILKKRWFFNQKLRFSPKTLASNISMLEPIQDNDNCSHMHKIIQIYPCLLKLTRKQEIVTDGRPLLLYPLTAITGG
jgi:hypothetical protein